MTEPRIQLLDDLEAEFGRLTAEQCSRHPSRLRTLTASPRRAFLLALSFVAALVGGAYSVSPVRGAFEDVASSFAGYLSGDDSAPTPGRALEPAELESKRLPPWLTEPGAEGQRVIASEGGYKLYATHMANGNILFSADRGFAVSAPPADWQRMLSGASISELGPLPAESGVVPYFGLTAGDVERVRVRYRRDDGSVTANATTGGFVVLLDPDRRPAEIVALDADSKVLERKDLEQISWRQL